MSSKFPRSERLKSKKLLERVFKEGGNLVQYPLRLRYMNTGAEAEEQLQIAISVSKRSFKSAVKRNRVKRLIREAYRLNKGLFFNNIEGNFAFLILYLGHDMPDYRDIEKAFKGLMNKLRQEVNNEKDHR